MTRQLKRQRSVHCPFDEQEMIRGKAKASGKTVSGYLLDLVRNDDPGIHPLVWSPEEQQEMLEGTRTLQAVARAVGFLIGSMDVSRIASVGVSADFAALRRRLDAVA